VVSDSGLNSVADAGLDPADQAAAGDRNRDLISRLSRRRAESGLSQADVARLMQTSQSAVARLESGQHDAQLSTVARYAEALGLCLDFGQDTWTPAEAAATPGPSNRPRPRPRQGLGAGRKEACRPSSRRPRRGLIPTMY
jgi:transcriptional regulator with XRE-family HTH domain